MKFLTNTFNPKSKYAELYFVEIIWDKRSKHEQWLDYLNWLRSKIISHPQATEKFTVEELEAMDIVGVYDE